VTDECGHCGFPELGILGLSFTEAVLDNFIFGSQIVQQIEALINILIHNYKLIDASKRLLLVLKIGPMRRDSILKILNSQNTLINLQTLTLI